MAPATAAGHAALAIVRVSGGGALGAAASCCRGLRPTRARLAQLVTVLDRAGEPLDRAVAISYRGPASFTGEDMVELILHGSPYVVTATVESLCAAGCRPAAAGEFTRRAVANGKMDLTQAEAIADLIGAETARQAKLARRQQEGALAERVRAIQEGLVAVLAALEASLDFVDHEVVVSAEEVTAGLGAARRQLAGLLATAGAGMRLRRGATVVITGAPNAGKSTLFNRLVGEARAIVSERPGTTRDLVEATLDLAGVPVRLVDTAGLHDDADPIGAEGVRRARQAGADADVRVLLWATDAAEPPREWWLDDPGMVRARSKCDRVAAPADGVLAVSGRTGQGVDALVATILAALGVSGGDSADGVLVNRRHRQCLEAAEAALTGLPLALPEVVAGGIRAALSELEELVGSTTDEAVLDAVFGRFCIGK